MSSSIFSRTRFEPLFGDGGDGAITRSSDLNENGIINATRYTLESGVTATVTGGFLLIAATDSITIDGTIDAGGQGGAAKSGGSGIAGQGDTSGTDGDNAVFVPQSSGGSGGDNAGNGGDGDTGTPSLIDIFSVGPQPFLELNTQALPAGASGGSGEGGLVDADLVTQDGPDGNAPGGGGGGGQDDAQSGVSDGGDSGAGGGIIILIAPDIFISGSLVADGKDGQDAADAGNAAGGGGGAGSGGFIGVYATNLVETSPTYDVSKGLGGLGGTADGSGGDGADGADGTLDKVVV